MAIPTAVNGQVTDAVTESNLSVLGNAPASALSALLQTHSHAVGIMLENAVAQQQNTAALANAVLTNCVNSLLSTGRSDSTHE